MARKLTTKEHEVLAHIVVDPDAWWAHASKPERKTPAEDALAAKVTRWKPKYDQENGKAGYKNRAVRNQEELDTVNGVVELPAVTLTAPERTKLEARMPSGKVDQWASMKVLNGSEESLREALNGME